MSRMDRYYRNDSEIRKRTNRNQELYRSIYDDSEYSNIEGIATINKSNEVDITKVKNMLKNREEYQRQKDLKRITPRTIEEPKFETLERDEDRTYDIRDILNKAKSSKISEDKYHHLNNTSYDILKQLKEHKPKEIEPDELKEMFDTITNTSMLNKLSDHELGLDMFEELKSDGNTTIATKDSIRSILDEAKKLEEKKKESTNTNLDNSFFTAGMKFNDDDFETSSDFKDMPKQDSIWKTIIPIIVIVATGIILFILFSLLK